MPNLHDNAKIYLNKVNNITSLSTMTATEARRMRAVPSSNRPVATLAKITNTKFTARDGAQISLRIYTPNGDGLFPIIIYYHGGGWVLNDLNTCHESCAELANKTNSIVVSVDYRLAPEYKFPTPVYDAFDALKWTREHASEFNGNPSNLSVAGDSAGGNLAIAAAQLASEHKIPLTTQLLLYPVTDLTYSSKSYNIFQKGYGLDKDVMEWFGNYYIRSEQDAENPLVAPLRAQDFSIFPPTYIIPAENDVLRDEAIQFAKKLQQAGVHTEVSIAQGLIHSFFTKNENFAEQITTTIEQIDDFLQRQLQ